MEPESLTHFVFAELLLLILTSLSTFDLLQCRLVSVHWKRGATHLLLKRGSLKLMFRMDSSTWPPNVLRNPKNITNPTFSSIPRSISDLCEDHFKLKRRQVETLLARKTLPSLFRLLTKPDQPKTEISPFASLPVGHFDFRFGSSELNRNQPQLISFLQVYGPKIRALSLENHPDYFVGHKGMSNFLLQYTPNLESLNILESQDTSPEIPPDFFPWKGSTGGQRIVTLPNLKFIHINRVISDYSRSTAEMSKPTFKILPHLLNIAPQLQRVTFNSPFDPKSVDIFQGPPCKINLLCLQNLFLNCNRLFFEGQEPFERLAQATMKNPQGLRLNSLFLQLPNWPRTLDSWKKGCWTLRQILETNLKTIRYITLDNQSASILCKIEGLPALLQVDTLGVNLDQDYSYKLPGGEDFLTWIRSRGRENSLSQLLPNLKHFIWSVRSWQDEERARQWFPYWTEKLTSVSSLRVELEHFHSTSDDEVKKAEAVGMALELCPNISRFEAKWPYCRFPVLLQPLYDSMTQLTSLTLTICSKDVENEDTFFDLDAALTGLSKESVTILYNHWKRSGQWDTSMLKRRRVDNDNDEEKQENWAVSRVNSSILELKNLRTLTFEFDFACNVEPRVLLSIVSGKLAFDLMKKVKVYVLLNFFRVIPRCADCSRESPKKNTWLKLHRPLKSFSNVHVNDY